MLCKSYYKASKMPFLVNRSYCLIGGLKPSSWPIGVSKWDARLVFGPPIGQLEAPVQWTGDIGEPEGPDPVQKHIPHKSTVRPEEPTELLHISN